MIDYGEILKLPVDFAKRYYWLSKRVPFRTFIPNRAQFDFIRSVGQLAPRKRVFLMTSGNGAGKTTVSINIIANLVWPGMNIYRYVRDIETGEEFPGFFNSHFFNKFPPNWPKTIWYVSNQESLKSIWKEFQLWIPEKMYHESQGGKTYVSHVEFLHCQDKWELSFRTIDQDPKTFESANVGAIIFDEPPTYSIYKASISRLRSGGIILIPATPLFGSSWFVDDIVLPSRDVDSDKYHQQVSVWSNCLERAGKWNLGIFGIHPKGRLHESDIQFTLDNYDPDEREARENGTFKHLVGLVYKTYGAEHFRDIEREHDPENYVWKFILDPHDRRPPAAIWIRIDRWGKHCVMREWPDPVQDKLFNGLPFHRIKSADPYKTEDFVKFFIQIFKDYRIDPKRVCAIIDPNYGKKPVRETGKMLFQIYQDLFKKHGYPISFVTNVVDDLKSGHRKVKDYLSPGHDGEIMLQIDRSCLNTDYSMRNYSHDEWEGKQADKRGLRETVKEIGKDFADLIRYGLMVEYKWRPIEGRKLSRYRQDYGAVDYYERPPGAAGV